MPRKPLGLALCAIFGLLALSAWAQVIVGLLGSPTKPSTLIAMQAASGAAAAATCWASWRRARWAAIAALIYGALATGLLVALPFILDLPAAALAGIRTGAVLVLVFALLSAAYFRADARRRLTTPPESSSTSGS